MLGLDFIRANRATVERAIGDKGVTLDLDALIGVAAEVRHLKTEIDRLRAERNASARKFKDAAPEEKAELGRQAKEAGAKASELERSSATRKRLSKALMLRVPEHSLRGRPRRARRDLQHRRSHGGRAAHVRLRAARPCRADREERLGRPVAASSRSRESRTYCLKGRLALLETKLMGWALEQDRRAQASRRSRSRRSRASRHSSTRASSPATSEETYELPNDDLWLAGTAEVALTSLHSGEIIEARQVADPLRRLLALLPPRGGKRGQGRPRAAARPPIREGRAICDLRGGRRAVGRMARAVAGAGGGAAAQRSKSPTR